MKVFVPRYRHNLPSINSDVLNELFIEIDERDLANTVALWDRLDNLQDCAPKEFFQIGSKQACKHEYHKRTLEPFLRRPHITIHCGAKDGAEDIKQITDECLYQAGYETAKNGFNLWYGGGNTGKMGMANRGFRDALKEQRFPDQYSVQIIPAHFAVEKESANGLRAANEGLGTLSDIAIIWPDFFTRREMLGNKCAAALSGPGGIGTIDELTDLLVYVKTGQRTTPIYVLDPYLPSKGRTFWSSLKLLFDDIIDVKFEGAATLQHLHFVDGGRSAMQHLVARLDETGQNPHMVYRAYCREHQIEIPPAAKLVAGLHVK